jgi:hypothetical protein
MLEEPYPAITSSQRWFQRLLWGGCGLFTVFLSSLVYLGTTARFLQDDYCFSVILSQKNLLDIYLNETTFSGNRFMLVLTTGLSERLGAWSVQILPGFLLVMWVIGLTLMLRQIYGWLAAIGKIRRELPKTSAWLLPLLISELVVFLSLYAAPNLIQIYYWRAGSLTYLAPLVVFSFLAWWMVRSLQRPYWRWSWLPAFLLAFAAAGYCETAAVFQLGVLALASAAVGGRKLWAHKPVQTAVTLLAAGWLGTLAAVIILLSSPANAPRFAGSYQSPPNVVSGLLGALSGAVLFVKLIFYWLPVTALFVIVFFALLSALVQSATGIEKLSVRWIIIWSLCIGVTTYLCIAASMFPSFAIEGSYPADRALLTARWISIIGLAGLGWMLGSALRSLEQIAGFKWSSMFGFGLLFGVLGVCVLFLPKTDLREISAPEIRDFLASQRLLVLSFCVGILLAAGVIAWIGSRKPAAVFGVLIIMSALVWVQPAGSSWLVFIQVPKLSTRAILWDRRDAQIRQMAAGGQQAITVRALDSLAGIGELHDDNNFWVNRCAAWYYQVNSIRAVEPVLTLP